MNHKALTRDRKADPAELARLMQHPDPTAAAVGRAIDRTVRDALDPGERGWVQAIEELREALVARDDDVDTALTNQRGVSKPMRLGDITHRRSKKGVWAWLLLLLTRELRPNQIIELGSCVGISGAFLAAGCRLNNQGRLVTLEGAPALAALAGTHIELLGARATVVPGLFGDTLGPALDELGAVELAFIDGHHKEEPTKAYFEQLLGRLAEPAVVVFDDIRWSDGMSNAWDVLRNHPAVRVAVDLDRVGICITGPGTDTVKVDLPSLSEMAAAHRRATRLARPPSLRHVKLDDLPIPRLNWGSGPTGEPGWLNSDMMPGSGVQLVGDIRDGLDLPDACLDYVVSIHALPMIPIPDLIPVLQELRRVLKPGGVLRLGLPDLEKGIAAWQRGDRDHFYVADRDAETLSGKFVTHMLWYGYTVTLFTAEWIEELLDRAGFHDIRQCAYRQSPTAHEGIIELDNREHESLFTEAVR